MLLRVNRKKKARIKRWRQTMSWYLFRKKNKCRRKTINRVQFDDDFIIKVFEHSRSVFQIMVFINGSIAAVIFAKDFSLYREMIGVIFSGIILSFILKSLSIGALFGYARSERNDSFTRTLSMFLETLSVIVLSVSLAFSIQFYPYKNHIVVKTITTDITTTDIKNIHPEKSCFVIIPPYL